MNEETKLVILDKILTTATLLKRSSIWQRNTSEVRSFFFNNLHYLIDTK